LEATECEFTTLFSESTLARTHYILKIASDRYRQIDRKAIEKRVIQFTRNWYDDLVDAAVDHWGSDKGRQIASRYRGNFPSSYRDSFDPKIAVKDIELFTSLEPDDDIAMSFYQPAGGAKMLCDLSCFIANRN
jgi:glutamate dehydrogenase